MLSRPRLHKACQEGNVTKMKELISANANLEALGTDTKDVGEMGAARSPILTWYVYMSLGLYIFYYILIYFGLNIQWIV